MLNLAGYIYLIRNKDLYKIGITKDIERRLKALKPDEVIKVLKTNKNEILEKKLHKRFRVARIPQTEYFRLNRKELAYCINKLSIASIRRSECIPIIIGFTAGLITPFFCIIWGFRQQSLMLGIIPISAVSLLRILDSNLEFESISEYTFQLVAGLIAFYIAKRNKEGSLK